MAKEDVILDATMLNGLMGCAQYFDFRYNHNFGSLSGKSNSLETGGLAHKVLEVYYKQLMAGFNKQQASGNAIIAGQLFINGCQHCAGFTPTDDKPKPECRHQVDEYPGVFNTPEENEGYRTGWKHVLRTMEEYFTFYVNDAWKPMGVETVRTELMYEDDELRVGWKAKFDLIVDTGQIGIVSMDHKTFKQRRDKTMLNNQFIGQCLLLKSRNVIVNKIGLQTSLKIADRLSREVVSYSADKLEEWRTEILPYYAWKYVQYIETGHWPKNYTHCDAIYGPCMYKQICEANRNMRAEIFAKEYKVTQPWEPLESGD